MASTEGSTLKGCLRAAREALSKGEYKEAIKEARTALKHDKRSYDAFLYIGKAAFFLEEYAQADVAYHKAVEINAAGLPAWQGLAELHGRTGDHGQLADACRHLVEGWDAAGQADKATLFRKKLAQALLDQGKREEARKVWAQVIKASKQDVAQGVEALCALADIEIANHAELVERKVQQRSSRHKKLAKAAAKSSGGPGGAAVDGRGIQREVEAEAAPALEAVLGRVVDETAPTPQYARYHVLHLERALAKLRQEAEADSAATKDLVLACSLRMIAGGASSPEPFLVALALCEEDSCTDLAAWKDGAADWVAADLDDTRLVRDRLFARLGKRLVHAFPSEGLGWVAVAAGLYARQLDSRSIDLDGVKAACQLGLRLDNNLPYGWHLLGTVQLAEASPAGALQCVQRGLEAVAELRERYGLSLRRAELRFRVLESRAWIDSGRTEEAATALCAIEDESESHLEGDDQKELRLAAIEGQARAAASAATGDAGVTLARLALERLLQAEPGSAWAYAQLGGLALRGPSEAAALDEARRNYEKAVQLEPGDATYHFKLGEIYWRLGGEYKADRQYAHAQFLEAARIDPGSARAFTFLGRFYHEVQGDETRGRRCFQKAVQMDPDDEVAGSALADMMAVSGQRRAEVAMCREACERSPRAYWAWRRMGFLEARAGRWQEALVSLQHVLRGQRKDGAAWEALALAYQRLGKMTAALKAYAQAEKLGREDERVPTFALLQAANIHVSLSNFRMASDKYQAVLQHVPTHAAALAGLASALLGQARRFQQQGAAQAAADLLADARAHAHTGTTLHGSTRALWKLLGDINLELAIVAPPPAAQPSNGSARGFLERIEAGRQVRVDGFRRSERAYRHAVHLNPGDASGWADLGACIKHKADFTHPVQEGTQKALHWGWRVGATKERTTAGAPLADQGLLLRMLAERLVMGALALEPGSAAHWATAGVVAQERGLQQHALNRALQLDPKLSAAWVNLGQLYLDEGDFPLARAAFDHARSCDPVLAVPWASMAFMDAAEARNPKHKKEALSTARHAVQMGPIPEGQLGFGGLAASLGQLDSPEVYIALRKAALQMPGVAAVHNLLGLACEARGLVRQAVESFENAGAVLEAQGGEGKAAESVALNLARTLAKAGRHAEAVQEYEKLRDGGAVSLETSAAAWRLYGLSLWRVGQTESATAALFQALQLAPPPMPDEAPPREHTAALCALAWIQYQAAGPKLALQTLRESVAECWRDAQVGLTTLAVAALASDNAAIAFAIGRCPALFEHDMAPRTHRVLSIAHRLQNNYPRSLHHLRTALHSHPDSCVLRAALSEALRLEHRHETAQRVVQGATQSDAGRLSNAESVEQLGTCIREAAESLLALEWVPERAAHNETLLRDLQRWIKIDPAAKHARALLALVVALRAQGSPGSQSLRWGTVRRLCRTALEVEHVEERVRGQGSTGVLPLHLDLQLLEAEALSQSRVATERELGRQHAVQLVEQARGQRDDGRVYAQGARSCMAAGDASSAEAHFLSATSSNDTVHDYMAYAAAQAAGGRFADALQTLQAAEYTAVKAGPKQRRWITAVHVARADILLKSGDLGAASAVASDAIAEEPDNPLLLLLQGALLSLAAESGSGGDASAAARRALSRAVHLLRSRGHASPWAHYLLGQAEVEGGGGRKGRDKWETSMRTAAHQWPHPSQPAELLYALAEVAATSEKHGGSGLCQFGAEGPMLSREQWSRRAVHVQPSCSAYSTSLRH